MRRIVAFMATACLVSAAWAGNPFVGRWKLDPSRSQQMAERLYYTDLGDGRMRFTNGATVRYDFAMDGKSYPAGEGRSVTWHQLGPGRWQMARARAGRTTETTTLALSADGDALVVHARGVLPDGTAYTHDMRYSRVGTGHGLAGEWRGRAIDTNGMPDGYVITEDAAGVITWEIPTDKQRLTGRFDGSDMVLSGPGVSTGTVFDMTRVSERRITYVMKTRGEPAQYGAVTISRDDNTFTEESWLPGKQEDKSVNVLTRYRCPPPGQPMPASDPDWLCAQR